MKYRLQMCVVGMGESVELPAFPIIVSIKEVSVSSGGAWKQVFEIYYLKSEGQAKPQKKNKFKG